MFSSILRTFKLTVTLKTPKWKKNIPYLPFASSKPSIIISSLWHSFAIFIFCYYYFFYAWLKFKFAPKLNIVGAAGHLISMGYTFVNGIKD